MRTIDAKDIDMWLFDYFEGNLTAEESITLVAFLNNNPLLKPDYEAWKLSYIKEPEIRYDGTRLLLKPENKNLNWVKWGLALILLLGVVGLIYVVNTDKEKVQYPLVPESITKKQLPAPGLKKKMTPPAACINTDKAILKASDVEVDLMSDSVSVDYQQYHLIPKQVTKIDMDSATLEIKKSKTPLSVPRIIEQHAPGKIKKVKPANNIIQLKNAEF